MSSSRPLLWPAIHLWAPMAASAPDLTKLRIDRDAAPIRRRRRRRWIWLAIVAVARRGGGGWFMLQPRVQAVQTTPVVTAYPSQQFVVLNATGYVVAQRKAAISSKATGRLEWLGVAEGSRVKAGDVIARIDNRDVVAQAQSAEAIGARRACERRAGRGRAHRTRRSNTSATRTWSRRTSSRSPRSTRRRRALDRAVAGVASAQANLNAALANARNAQVAVDYTQIRAPFDGVILSKSANVGDLVTPFSNADRLQGRRRDDGRHEHARSRGRRVGVEPGQGPGRPAGGDRARRAARRRASAAASAGWCRPSTARRRR